MASSEQVKIILVSEDNASASIKDATQAVKDLGAESKKITKGSKKDWSGLGDLFGKVLPRNLQSLMRGFKGTQRQVGRLAKGFKALKAAWASIGIGLILIALEELISNWDTITDSINGVTKASKQQLATDTKILEVQSKITSQLAAHKVILDSETATILDKNAALAEMAKMMPELADLKLGDEGAMQVINDAYDDLLEKEGLLQDNAAKQKAHNDAIIASKTESVKLTATEWATYNNLVRDGGRANIDLAENFRLKTLATREAKVQAEFAQEEADLLKIQLANISKINKIDEKTTIILSDQAAEQKRILDLEKEQAEAAREAEAARKRSQQSREADEKWLANERVRIAEEASIRLIADDEKRELKALKIQQDKQAKELLLKGGAWQDLMALEEEFEVERKEITDRFAAEKKAQEDQDELDAEADALELKTQVQTDQQNELDALAIFFEEKKLLTEKDSEDYKTLVQQQADETDAINAKYRNKTLTDLKKEQNAKIASAVAYGNAVRGVVGGISDLMEENSKEQKALAITEVLLAQAISIAQAIKGANSAGSNGGPAAPVITPLLVIQMVGSVLAGFVGVKKILNEAGASGGGGGGVSSGSFGGGGGSSVASMAGNVQVPLPARLDSPDAMQAYVVQSQLDGQMQSQQNLEGQIVL